MVLVHDGNLPRLNEGETRKEASTLLPEPAIIKLSIQASNVDNHLELPILFTFR